MGKRPYNATPRDLRNCFSEFGTVRNGMPKILPNRLGTEFNEFNEFRETVRNLSSFASSTLRIIVKLVCSRRPALFDFHQSFWQRSMNRLFLEFWTFQNSAFSEYQKVWYSSLVSNIQILNRISEFCRPLATTHHNCLFLSGKWSRLLIKQWNTTWRRNEMEYQENYLHRFP